MEKEINNSKESLVNNNQNNIHIENILHNDSNKDNFEKDSAMTQIKNMFVLNQGVDQERINTFHNSLKMFKKRSLNTNSESSHTRTKSNENKKEKEKYMNNKNFPSKAAICKGIINNNTSSFMPPKSSPIVQYYATGQDSIETANNLGYLESPVGPVFNFSPSQIFNNSTSNVGSGKMSIKSGKSIEPITLNGLNEGNEGNNLDENLESDKNEYITICNDENEKNINKNEKINLNDNENKKENNDDKNNKIKENNLDEKEECSENTMSDNYQIRDALKKLKRKKSKVSEDSENNSELKNKNNLNNNKNINNNKINNINEEKEEKNIFKNDEVLDDLKPKNNFNNFDNKIINEEKNRINSNIEEKFEQNENEKIFMNNNNLNLNKNINNNLNNYINNNINSNQINNNLNDNYYQNLINLRNKAMQNNPNLINNNYINNNLNNNYNNSFIQFNYMLNNNNNPNQFNLMMNNNSNRINNNNMNYPNNINNNNINSYNNINNNQDFQKKINQFYLNSLNNNSNIDLQNYNGLLQTPGNINIQNNYFLYNNNNNKGNNETNKEEKQKKKKKNKKIKKLEQNSYINKDLNFYIDNFKTISKDQGGSRYLQTIIVNYSPNELNYFFDPLFQDILNLINDPFANYLIQKLLPFFNQEQLLKILNAISSKFYDISCNSHGTRVLQELIELIKTEELRKLFYDLIEPKVSELLKDLNGTYIIQKFVNLNLSNYGIKINSIIIDNSIELCSNKHGCCVIQKYLETRDPNMIPQLIYKLLNGFPRLIIDQFGNYVIKTILLINIPEYSNRIGEYILTNVIYYSKHKYSSNVVEKCFEFCKGIVLNKLILKVQDERNLRELITDEHGNYVVQKVLSITNIKKRKEMLYIIKGLFPLLKQTQFGQRIIHRISSTYPDIFNI